MSNTSALSKVPLGSHEDALYCTVLEPASHSCIHGPVQLASGREPEAQVYGRVEGNRVIRPTSFLVVACSWCGGVLVGIPSEPSAT